MTITISRSAPQWDQAPPFGRRQNLLATLQYLHAIKPGPACIVETGTTRDENSRDGDGWSTVAWGWYAASTGGACYTVDISEDCLNIAKQLTIEYARVIHYVKSNSIAFLRGWDVEADGPVHLLYLDSLDFHDSAASIAHSMAEAQAAIHALAPQCLVLFDDTHPTGKPDASGILTQLQGKGALSVPWMLRNGFDLEWAAGGQVLLSRGVLT